MATKTGDISELAGQGVLQALHFIEWGERALVTVLYLEPRPISYPAVETAVVHVFTNTLGFVQDAWFQLGKGSLSEFSRQGIAHALASDTCTGRVKQLFTSDFQSKFKSKIRDLEQAGQALTEIMNTLVFEVQDEGMCHLFLSLYYISNDRNHRTACHGAARGNCEGLGR